MDCLSSKSLGLHHPRASLDFSINIGESGNKITHILKWDIFGGMYIFLDFIWMTFHLTKKYFFFYNAIYFIGDSCPKCLMHDFDCEWYRLRRIVLDVLVADLWTLG